MEKFEPTEYKLLCLANGAEFDDAGWTLDCAECKTPSLIRAQYQKKQLTIYNDKGLYKYRDWLPM